MAPKANSQSQRRQTFLAQGETLHQLGKQGRKTGITLPEAPRDEHGFEEMDNLFSSPEKDIGNGAQSDDEQDMDIDDGSEPGPATTRKMQGQGRLPVPRARSPVKTTLQSPARQNPHLGPTSSPTRGSIVTTKEKEQRGKPMRKLNFGNNAPSVTAIEKPRTALRINGTKSAPGKKMNGPRRSPSPLVESQEDEPLVENNADEPEDEEEEDSMELLDAAATAAPDDDDEPIPDAIDEVPSEPEPEEPVQEPKAVSKAKPSGKRGRKPKPIVEEEEEENVPEPEPEPEPVVEEEPVKKRKGRPKASPVQTQEPSPPSDPSPPVKTGKRGRPARNSTGETEESHPEPEQSRETKRQKTQPKAEKSAASRPATKQEKSKPGRKRKSSGVGVDSPAIQRGPPLPKSRGLVTVRREDSAEMKTTRSGRSSFKPLEWWKGEHVEYDDENEEVYDMAGYRGQNDKRHFKMRTIKGVVRTEDTEEETRSKRRGRPASARPRGRPAAIQEEVLDRDEWEDDPGRVTGEVIYWYPEHEFNPPQEEDQVEVVPEELAISEAAIQLKDIKDATFKFAKTLTMPFFGSGIVDLPPGAEKRPKNSRKMHLTFFVHTGTVEVTVAQTVFNISKGGQFFVPRGNHYSITNNSDHHSRIFFAQGCEIFAQPEDAKDDE
ncbi:hypothetical protein GGR57DRAFT_463321 [Xylariaceae sp. FL1272]|nr:hypothetical protein GGR57DRAFT_463321 [Xylariaceae sp. FL1272]